MMLPLHDRLRTAVRAALHIRFGLDAQTAEVPLEVPPSRAFGDVGSPVAFELARTLRKAPRAIAQELAAALGPIDGVVRVDAAPNGYLNVFLDRAAFLRARLDVSIAAPPSALGKTIVEHTAINPNKAAHIGHLRNACLGDTLVRALRFRGRPVEVQNYIDDTGVQVADVVVGFRHLEGLDFDGVRRLAETTRFDYYCWDLYARVTEWYEQDGARLEIRAATLHDIEHGGNASAAIGALVADRIVRTHLVTMARLGIDYDLLTWEGDILRMRFWARAFERLKASGTVFLQAEGKLAGCWVMRIDEDGNGTVAADTPVDEAVADDAEQREKVIVRSNGTVTYVGKDMAYQFWKLGLLGFDFHYRTFTVRADGRPLWATTSDPALAETPHPTFGAAETTFNVIDVRQAYLQQLLKQALAAAGHPAEAARHTHFAYEMVALSHSTAAALGFAPPADSDEAKRPFVEVSGRKGLGVKADDLLDRLIDSAQGEVARRNPELAAAEARRTAERIGVAAVRYFMVKYSRTKVIAFDIDEALSFEGESGPYLQYAVVRAQNILQKLRDRDGVDDGGLTAGLASQPPRALVDDEHADRLWSLVLEAARLDDVVDTAIRTLEFAVLAKFSFGLAQSFNALYHAAPILAEDRQDVRLWRAAAILYVRRQLTTALAVMGIDVPARM